MRVVCSAGIPWINCIIHFDFQGLTLKAEMDRLGTGHFCFSILSFAPKPHTNVEKQWKGALTEGLSFVFALPCSSRHDRLAEYDLRLIAVDDRLVLHRALLDLSVAKVVVCSSGLDLCSRIRVAVAQHD